MPLVSAPVLIDGLHYLDGGICDSVPFAYARQSGLRKQVVVLSKPRGHRLETDRLLALERMLYRAYPRFVEACARRLELHNRQYAEVERLHDAGELFAIWPDRPVRISLMEKDPDKLLSAWVQGYEQAMRQWDALECYLGM